MVTKDYSMTSQWQPYREPLSVTIMRTGVIAIVAGAVVAGFWGGLAHFGIATLLALWFSFGGHWVELWFLNWLRPRISRARGVQVAARVAVWFVGGAGLAIGMGLTAMALTGFRPGQLQAWQWRAWWIGGWRSLGSNWWCI